MLGGCLHTNAINLPYQMYVGWRATITRKTWRVLHMVVLLLLWDQEVQSAWILLQRWKMRHLLKEIRGQVYRRTSNCQPDHPGVAQEGGWTFLEMDDNVLHTLCYRFSKRKGIRHSMWGMVFRTVLVFFYGRCYTMVIVPSIAARSPYIMITSSADHCICQIFQNYSSVP